MATYDRDITFILNIKKALCENIRPFFIEHVIIELYYVLLILLIYQFDALSSYAHKSRISNLSFSTLKTVHHLLMLLKLNEFN
jgi:hypothetical protein